MNPLMRIELEALNSEFAWLIDRGDSALVAELFTEDGVYERSTGQASVGRDAIRAAYTARLANGPRTSRHIFTNFRVVEIAKNRAFGTCLLTLFAQDGEPPLPSIPLAIADYDDEYLCCEDGQWRFVRRRVTWIFRDLKRINDKGLPLGVSTP